MTDTQATATGNEDNPGPLNFQRVNLWKPLLVLAVFAIAISLAGTVAFLRYKESVKINMQNELGGMAELKTGQIINWIAERKGDAQTLKDDSLFVTAIDHWLQQGGRDGETKQKLAGRLTSLQRVYAAFGYTSITLFDDKLRLRLSTSAEEAPTRGMGKARLQESMRSGQVAFSEIHREQFRSGEKIEIELSAPLTLVKNGKSRTVGLILFRIDPARFLYPLIQSWPTSSASAETLLVRRDGDEVVFLNELRLQKNTPLTLRFPLSDSQLLAAMAVRGWQGMVEGVDYRGMPVIGVLGKVAGTSWFMVAKVDKAEIYAPVNRLAGWMLLLLLSLIGAGSGAVAYWRNKEQKQHEYELNQQEISLRLDHLSKYANDIIILLDEEGKIVDFNDRALEAYGYSAREFANLYIFDLHTFDSALQAAGDLKKLQEAGATRFESMHVRRDGTAFPVEYSTRMVIIDRNKFYQTIIRDISERKQAEEELFRQKNLLRQVIDSDPNLIFVKDAGGKILLANEATAKIWGHTPKSIVGKYNWQLVDNQELVTQFDLANREVLENREGRVAIEKLQNPDGQNRILQTIRKPLLQDDGTINVLTIAMDITALKNADEDMRKLNRTLMLLGECNALLIRAEDEKRLLAEICMLLVETGGYHMAWVGFAEHSLQKPVRPAAKYGYDEGYLDNLIVSWADNEQGRGPTGSAIRTGKTQVNQDFRNNFAMAPWREAAMARGYLSSIALPLKGTGECFGALTIYAAEINTFNANEIKLLEELAGNLAYGIAALRIAAEHKSAVALLEKERAHLRTLVHAIPDLVWLKDAAGIYMSCNRRFELFFGAKEADIVGKTDHDFVDKKLADSFREDDLNAMAANRSVAYEKWLTFRSDGYRGYFETVKTPLIDNQGRLIGVLGVARDITERITAAKAIQELNADLAATLKAIPDLLFELGQNGEYINIWTQNPELLEVQKELLLGHTVSEMLPPEAARTVMSALGEAAEKGYSHGHVIRLRLDREEDSWFELSVSVKSSPDASSKRFIMLSRDITERKRTEVELRFKNTLLTTEQEASIEGILICDEVGKIISYNRRFVDIWGIVEEIVASGADERVLDAVLAQLVEPKPFIAKIQSLYDRRDQIDRDEIVLRDDRAFEYYTAPMIGPHEEYYGRIWYFHDITEQKLQAKKLAASYAQLQQLSLHVENVRTEERAIIALNLHDEMGATLAAMKMRVAWLASKLPTEAQHLSAEVAHIAELLTGGIQTLRRIVSQLKPELPDDVGFAAVVQDYLKQFQRNTNVECTLILREQELAIDGNQSATLFRILQESLNNVAKHSQADKVNVMITQGSKALIMTIEDNGIGFDLDARKLQSFGLLGIRERALMVGGYADISSKSGKGTQLSVCIPVPVQHQTG